MTMRRSSFLALVLLGLVLAGMAQASPPNLLVNGDFESEPNYNNGNAGNDGWFSGLTAGQLPGWTIEQDTAVTIHVSPGFYATISGTYSANMDGEGYLGHNANFYQDFASSDGAPYQLDFDWCSWLYMYQGGTQVPKLNVSIEDMGTNNLLFPAISYSWDGGPFTGNYTDHGPVHHETVFFSGTGNSLRLRVQEYPESTNNDNMFIMDNFSVTITVPEPTTTTLIIWLLLGGLGLSIGWKRKLKV